MLAAAVLLGACVPGGGGDGSMRQRPDPGTDPAVAAAYRTALATRTRPVRMALGNVATATSYESLNTRLDRAQEASRVAAVQLDKLAAPAEVRAAHSDLVGAFRQLKGDLAFLSVDVSAQDLCTASVVLPRIAKLGGMTAAHAAGRALAAKGYPVDLRLPARAGPARRPLTGQFIRPGTRTGRGVLKIRNSGDRDVVVTLALGTRPVYSVYVRKRSNHQVSGIRDGTYRIFVASGREWDPRARGFARECHFERYDEPFKYWTSVTATRIGWSVWTIGMGGGDPANTPVSELLPGDAPAV